MRKFILAVCITAGIMTVGCSNGGNTAVETAQTAAEAIETMAEAAAEETAAADTENPVYIYLIRHGQTLFNQRHVAQGWVDSPLTEEGWTQAQAAAKGLADVEFTAAYSSVSERAMDTANTIIEGRDLELVLMEDLKEMNFGEFEAEPDEVLWGEGMKDADYRKQEGWVVEGGENYELLGMRVTKALDQIVEENKQNGGNVLVSSHGMAILSAVMKLDPEEYDAFTASGQFSLSNCAVCVIEYKDGQYDVIDMNNVSYRDIGLQ